MNKHLTKIKNYILNHKISPNIIQNIKPSIPTSEDIEFIKSGTCGTITESYPHYCLLEINENVNLRLNHSFVRENVLVTHQKQQHIVIVLIVFIKQDLLSFNKQMVNKNVIVNQCK